MEAHAHPRITVLLSDIYITLLHYRCSRWCASLSIQGQTLYLALHRIGDPAVYTKSCNEAVAVPLDA